MAFQSSTLDLQQQRIQALVSHFERVQRERMHDVPILNLALRVEAVNFVFPAAARASDVVGEGVLITPWFMSLMRLPLYKQAHGQQLSRTFVRGFGVEEFDFIGAYDHALGYHETCALFSPMFEFTDHAHARETAEAALAEIRSASTGRSALPDLKPGESMAEPAPVAPPIAQPKKVQPAPVAMPSRRFFLIGRAARGDA
jgi:[NiFe] hydrogenase assembly HybE family chaperone